MPDELTPSSGFFTDVRGILADARRAAYTAVNSAMVAAYWQIGRRIVEEEQGGSAKSTYGDRLLPELSRALTAEFGKGFSYANLRNFRQFYLTYPDPQICYAVRSKLTWTHHRLIMRVESPSAREYYITHAERENWSTRTLERQIETHTYQRLLSTQTTPDSEPATLPAKPSIRDFIKDPYVLEFLGLPEDPVEDLTPSLPQPLHRNSQHINNPKSTILNRQSTLRLRRRPDLAHPCKVHSSALLGDRPARHSPQDGGGCAFAVQNSFLSHDRRIANGHWCLLRELSDRSRNGKGVIVQSRDIQDPDTCTTCTHCSKI
jgi:hypothetical protein